mgnify:CR=1 FL=1
MTCSTFISELASGFNHSLWGHNESSNPISFHYSIMSLVQLYLSLLKSYFSVVEILKFLINSFLNFHITAIEFSEFSFIAISGSNHILICKYIRFYLFLIIREWYLISIDLHTNSSFCICFSVILYLCMLFEVEIYMVEGSSGNPMEVKINKLAILRNLLLTL